MEAIGFGQSFRNAWGDACGFAKARPGVSLTVPLLILLAVYVSLTLTPMPGGAGQAGAATVVTKGLLGLLTMLVQSTLQIALSVQVCRHVVLRGQSPHAPLFGSAFWRYVWVISVWMLLALMLFGGFAVFVALLEGSGVARQTLVPVATIGIGVLAIVMLFVCTRLILLLPQAAAGRRLDWRAAWQDSHGHFWGICTRYVAASLPVLVVSLPVGLLLTVMFRDAATPVALYAVALGQAFLNIVLVFVTGSSMGWLHRRYADRLLAAA